MTRAAKLRSNGWAAACLYMVVIGCTEEGNTGSTRIRSERGVAGNEPVSGGAPTSPGAGGSSTSHATVILPSAGVPAASQGGQGSGEGGGGKAECGSVQIASELKTTEMVVEVPGNVLFVFDQSSSMNEDWNGSPKWSVANAALVAAFTPLQAKLSAGAVLYPTPSPDADSGDRCNWALDWRSCVRASASRGGNVCPDVQPITSAPQIPIQAGTDFLGRWVALWASAQAATGFGTPTEKGMLQAEAALLTPLPGNTALVLVTDGEPTCGSNEDAIAARLLQKGIKTHVVGLPGVNGAAFLDRVALAGGTAPAGCTSNCYISPSDSAAFQSALAAIASTTITTTTSRSIDACSFGLSAPVGADPTSVHLVVTDAASSQQYEVPQPDGWMLNGETATLSPDTCELARSGAFLDLTFQYGCVTAPILPPR